MAHPKKRPTKLQAQRQVRDLQRAAAQLPGVAELVQLYEQHARTMQQAKAYQAGAAPLTIIASGASSA
jgi:hypothetical protein